ncbi:uncharacterized protein F4812DRAFT_356233 [Daldinia caldariorum]|uniref:uncharacterized protein n=1 Tax=Daldinia caldariorum TaxID=326644 RepID=UPI00200884CB|nr:uncharacterized protein F4812DRAFT_356233 [Daldinia caldariorum]KAI1469046.1 hypothetical protein F4812DRAFT_356233 [Daldinia caldariorum]
MSAQGTLSNVVSPGTPPNPGDDVTDTTSEASGQKLTSSPNKVDEIIAAYMTTAKTEKPNVLSAESSYDQSEAAENTPVSPASAQEQDVPEEQCTIPSGTTTEATSIIYFDIDSDLDVPFKAESGVIICKVSSAQLALASTVWRTMLYGDKSMKRSEKEHLVLNIDGDVRALIMLFHIIHYEFDRVPVKLSLDELHSVADVISRYQCAHLIYPWAKTWINSIPMYDNPEEHYRSSPKAAFVAWVLGDISLFLRSVEQVILSSKLIDGQLVDLDGNSLRDLGNINESLLVWISTTRLEILSQILHVLNEPFRQPSSDDKSLKPPFCKLGSQQKVCEAMMLGSMIPQLIAAGLFPVPEPSEFQDSIDTLRSKINDFKYTPYEGRDWMPHLSHISCSLGYVEAVQLSLGNMRVPLSRNFIDEFGSRARVSGIM